ncbi:VOC family protein [Methylovirgula sp. 4M-Z18]|uniref:VOC family protein n=1 Tax=Methylovirgula sp. 4M-Z18 TaxID=2293567 RepID=UPI000E2FBC5E|nr:VOC family protein [Methylovirgula sp. 4M-Z18]RFB79955.1 glyoxalase [Methylovirgula sp. 4M-Z18]
MFVSFAELPVFDQARAKAFYVDKFGCQVVADAAMGAGGWRWIEVGFPGAETSLHFVRRQDEAPSNGPVLVFVADDVPSAVHGLALKGVKIVADVTPAPYDPRRQVAEIEDSEGNRIVISN